MHTTDAYGVQGVVDSGRLEPSACPVFGEDLLYFFYGRPAYRPSGAEPAVTLRAFFPVCFVLHPDPVRSPKRMYSFDSGAMNGGIFDTFLHHAMSLGDFALRADADTPGRVVSAFFGSNECYLRGRVQDGLAFPALELQAECYFELARAKEKPERTIANRRSKCRWPMP